MNDVKCGTEESRPEFVAILTNFKDELAKLDENSSVIMEKVCQLRDFREPTSEKCDKKNSESGIIGELEECIRRISEYNCRLADVKNGLTKFIG